MIANKEAGAAMPHQSVTSAFFTTGAFGSLADRLDHAALRTRDWLLDRQAPDGHWVGELEGDTILESEYILLLAYWKREREPLAVKLGAYLRSKARPEGGWAIYPDGPFDLSASVKGYFALKLIGVPTDDPVMARARELILEAGGARTCNSFTRFYLALLGQIDYSECPSVPPELVLLPRWAGLNLDAMSAWTRTIIVPLSIMSATKPCRRLGAELGIAELFVDAAAPPGPPRRRLRPSWKGFFQGLDRFFKLADRILPASFRKPGVSAAHRWMLEHFENSDGLGAIFPPMIYTVVALDCLGYEPGSPVMQWAWRQLEDLLIEESGSIRVQPCVSPIWDTAITIIALADSKLPGYHPAVLKGVRWLLDKEVRVKGDWCARRPGVEPTGWHFQFRNELYPDIDDTAMVLLALQRAAISDERAGSEATRRATAWLLAMQNRDGGWAAFDADVTNQVLTKVPFADHNAMLDPSCADITGRVIEALGVLGESADHPAIARGLEYLWATQEPEGCWYGRWGVNYIYGTWQVLQGLSAINHPTDHPAVVRAAGWLESVQQSNGGWGESCRSYDDPTWMGRGEATASQTSWAILGLLAAGRVKSESVRRGLEFLLESQLDDGAWEEPEFTGTGFPRVFYLKYHLYRVYFPLMAIARSRAAGAGAVAGPAAPAFAARIPALPRSYEA